MSKKSILILFFIIGIIFVFMGRIVQVQLRHDIFTPQKSTFTFKSPERALQGKVRASIGEVQKQPRDDDQLKKINVTEPVLQGDKIVTGKSAALTVQFADTGIVNIKGDSEVNVISLVSANFLMQQVNGTVTYEALGNTPLSVRSMHVLFALQSGIATVETDKDTSKVTLTLTGGKGKIAMIDINNDTHTWDLKAGQRAVINDEEKTVKITK